MKVHQVFLFSFLCSIECLDNIERNGTCTNPNGLSGRCISFRDCKHLQDDSKTNGKNAIELARELICGIDTEVLVCCLTSEQHHTEGTSQPKFRGKNDDKVIAPEINEIFPNRSICGIQKASSKIVGGDVTDLEEFPWMVALEYRSMLNQKYKGIGCSGSLINNRYVLTAAHCLFYPGLELTVVRLGEWDITTDPDCQTVNNREECADRILRLKIKKQIIHPFFQRKSLIHDIALLQLEHDVTYTEYIQPICLPIQDQPLPPLGTNMTVAGWGTTEDGVTSHVKLKVSVPLVENFKCVDSNSYINGEICAGGVEGKDSCNGDSGGPLMKTYDDYSLQKNQWYQEGLVSWGFGCGKAGIPAVYTRVSKYMKWIESSIKNGESPSCATPPPSNIKTKNNATSKKVNSQKNNRILPDKSICGLINKSQETDGEGELNKFPWIALLEYKSSVNGEYKKIFGGGSLIHSRYLLTAATYLLRPELELVNIFLGRWNLNPEREILNDTLKLADNLLKFRVKKQIVYPSDPLINNIALLQLEQDVTYTDYIRPICLPVQNEPHLSKGTKMTVTGLRATIRALASRIKFKASLPPAPPLNCIKQLQQDHNYCKVSEEAKSSCHGHAGGPLMETDDQKQWYQDGVIVEEPSCKTTTHIVKYVKVNKYITWIESTIRDEEKSSDAILDKNQIGNSPECPFRDNSENSDHPLNDNSLPTKYVCGIDAQRSRIIGGKVTELGEFPWTVALEYTSRVNKETAGIRCGGTLINNQYVLTAAHCILDPKFQLQRAWLGDWDITIDPDCIAYGSTFQECSDAVLKVLIKEAIPHYLYDKRNGHNDIGLLKLDYGVQYTDYIRPICLPPMNQLLPFVGTKMIVAGWGATENGTSSKVLLKVSVPLVSNEQCSNVLGFLTGNQMCAGGEPHKDSCQGDSGGPLMIIYQDPVTYAYQWYQQGIVSYGIDCGREGYPAVYTRVSKYIQWIRQIIL